MSDIKFCPKCQKEVHISETICVDCGYEFVKEKTVVVSNTVDKNDRFDPVPTWLWTVICFILPPVGLILYFCFRKKWHLRADAAKDGAVLGLIVWAIALLFVLFFAVDYRKLLP